MEQESLQDSDEELTLIQSVESLQSQLRKAGDPVAPGFAKIFMQSVESESQLPARLKKWRKRKSQLQQLVDNPTANSPRVATEGMP